MHAPLRQEGDSLPAPATPARWPAGVPAARRAARLPGCGAVAVPAADAAQGADAEAIAAGFVPGTYIATVTFRSYEESSEVPNHSDSCDDWTLDYTTIQSSGRWLIDNANSQPGVPEYQSCG